MQTRSHSKVSGYGKGKELQKSDIERLIHHMVLEKILAERFEVQPTYGTIISYLILGPKASQVELGSHKIELALKTGKRIKRTRSCNNPLQLQANPTYQKLLSDLKNLCKKCAEESKVVGLMPYMVFNQKELEEICRNLPTTLLEFNKINGVGNEKLKSYGPTFTEFVRNFVEQNPEIRQWQQEVLQEQKPASNGDGTQPRKRQKTTTNTGGSEALINLVEEENTDFKTEAPRKRARTSKGTSASKRQKTSGTKYSTKKNFRGRGRGGRGYQNYGARPSPSPFPPAAGRGGGGGRGGGSAIKPLYPKALMQKYGYRNNK